MLQLPCASPTFTSRLFERHGQPGGHPPQCGELELFLPCADGALGMDVAEKAAYTYKSTSCNTEKDSGEVRERTAGIIVTCWACGIIVGAGELYGTERYQSFF